jgi:hypothetical protein
MSLQAAWHRISAVVLDSYRDLGTTRAGVPRDRQHLTSKSPDDLRPHLLLTAGSGLERAPAADAGTTDTALSLANRTSSGLIRGQGRASRLPGTWSSPALNAAVGRKPNLTGGLPPTLMMATGRAAKESRARVREYSFWCSFHRTGKPISSSKSHIREHCTLIDQPRPFREFCTLKAAPCGVYFRIARQPLTKGQGSRFPPTFR